MRSEGRRTSLELMADATRAAGGASNTVVQASFKLALVFAGLAALGYAQNPTVDFSGLQQRAEAGDAAAQFELGVRYHEGQGVAQSYSEAFKWFSWWPARAIPMRSSTWE